MHLYPKLYPESRRCSYFINFKNQILTTREKLVTTSCGFTFYWQSLFNKLTSSNIVTSSLCSLEEKRKYLNDNEILIFTFDAEQFLLISKLKYRSGSYIRTKKQLIKQFLMIRIIMILKK